MNKQPLYRLNTKLERHDLIDALDEKLCKASSLASYALTESISDHLNNEFRHYLWTIEQLLAEACEINKALSIGNK